MNIKQVQDQISKLDLRRVEKSSSALKNAIARVDGYRDRRKAIRHECDTNTKRISEQEEMDAARELQRQIGVGLQEAIILGLMEPDQLRRAEEILAGLRKEVEALRLEAVQLATAEHEAIVSHWVSVLRPMCPALVQFNGEVNDSALEVAERLPVIRTIPRDWSAMGLQTLDDLNGTPETRCRRAAELVDQALAYFRAVQARKTFVAPIQPAVAA